MSSVDRVDAILRSLSAGDASKLPLASVAAACGLDKSTTLRYLSALEDKGFVERDPHSSLYSLGLRLFELGQIAARDRDVRGLALPLMREVAERFGETVNLAIFRGSDVIIIEAVEGTNPIRKGRTVGERDLLHCTSLGKAVLSALPVEERGNTLAELDLVRLTQNTITDVRQLERELLRTAERGFAIDDEEGTEGVTCVGVAVRDEAGYPRYALSLTGPPSRLTAERLDEIGPVLATRGMDLSRLLGHVAESEGRGDTVSIVESR